VRADRLKALRVQRVEMCGVYPEPPAYRLVVWGLHGGDEFVTGLRIGDAHVERAGRPIRIAGVANEVWSGETCDGLRLRATREVAPTADALRDPKGAVVGYFVYSCLPPDHCRKVAEREARP